jgi:hypothetical protein
VTLTIHPPFSAEVKNGAVPPSSCHLHGSSGTALRFTQIIAYLVSYIQHPPNACYHVHVISSLRVSLIIVSLPM